MTHDTRSNMVIIDWDDTLFPTSVLQDPRTSQAYLRHPEGVEQLNRHGMAMATLLRNLSAAGCQVAIVTLANRAWFNESWGYMSAHLPSLSDLGILVYFAGDYQARYANESCPAAQAKKMKQSAMVTALNEAFARGGWSGQLARDSAQLNVISIGDDWAERAAVFDLFSNQRWSFQPTMKSVKFVIRANVPLLTLQLQELSNPQVLNHIIGSSGHLDLMAVRRGNRVQFEHAQSTLGTPNSAINSLCIEHAQRMAQAGQFRPRVGRVN